MDMEAIATAEGLLPVDTSRLSPAVAAWRQRVAELYEAHRDGIYRFLTGHGLPPALAQERTQDVFVDLFVALQKGGRVESEQGWLYTVAARSAVDYWRRERSTLQVELDLEKGPAAQAQSGDLSPEAQTEHRERERRIAAALGRLSKEHRLCIQLRMQGLRYREIAKILGVSTSTAAEWLVSAVNSLRGESQ
jgi:RNA polymerase sigma-70 factor (ECF subfamily)